MKRRLVVNQNVQYTDHRNNSAEEEFVHRAEKQGLLPLSRGWPDFLYSILKQNKSFVLKLNLKQITDYNTINILCSNV